MKENGLQLLSNDSLHFHFPANSRDQILEVGSLLLKEWVYTTQLTVVWMKVLKVLVRSEQLLLLSVLVQFYFWACSTIWRKQYCCDEGWPRWRRTLWPKPQETCQLSTEDWWWAGWQHGAPKVAHFKFKLLLFEMWVRRKSSVGSLS